MKVLLWLSRGTEVPGGHKVQLERTAAALRSLGVQATEHLGAELPPGSWDVIHGFQLGSHDVFEARRRAAAVAVSTIYTGLAHATGSGRGRSLRARAGGLRRGLRYLAASSAGRERLVRLAMTDMDIQLDQLRAWSMADVLLPNAHGEARHIREDLGVLTPCSVVPNAIDATLFTPRHGQEREPGTVLCVGRIEPHKNQLGVIEALRDVPGVRLTVVGPPHPHHNDYFESCQAAARGNVTLVPGIEHDELPELYARHRTHVLASWYETTGLVSLEAGASGCTVVSTDRGHAREYLGDDAWYCDPASSNSIRQAVLSALNAPPSEELSHRIGEQFTWRHTAEQTLVAYHTALGR